MKTVKEIASIIGGEVIGDGSVKVSGVSSIEEAGAGDITFLSDLRHRKYLKTTMAAAIVTGSVESVAAGKNLIVVKDPYLAFATVLRLFKPVKFPAPGIHPSAIVHESAHIGRGASIGACVVVEEGVKIGDRTVIHPGVYVGADSGIGDDSVIYSNVSIREGSKIGKGVIIHCNSVVGSDGFGYVKEKDRYVKIPQTGNVTIGDDVELGACVTIDRATIGSTVIARGTKIDNLVQIAHNVAVGEDTVIVAQAGIAGSTKVGSRVTIAGQAGLAGHIEVTDDVVVGAKSGVTKDIAQKGAYTGYPAMPHNEWLRAQALFSKLPEIYKRLCEIEKKLEVLEKE